MRVELKGLAGIILLFLLLGVVYAAATPPFEASDEIWHYPVVKHIADGNGLPVQNPSEESAWQQEGSQPPLYYLLMAGLTFWVDTDDLSERLWYNPHARIGIPLAHGNKNMGAYQPGPVSLAGGCVGRAPHPLALPAAASHVRNLHLPHRRSSQQT